MNCFLIGSQRANEQGGFTKLVRATSEGRNNPLALDAANKRTLINQQRNLSNALFRRVALPDPADCRCRGTMRVSFYAKTTTYDGQFECINVILGPLYSSTTLLRNIKLTGGYYLEDKVGASAH